MTRGIVQFVCLALVLALQPAVAKLSENEELAIMNMDAQKLMQDMEEDQADCSPRDMEKLAMDENKLMEDMQSDMLAKDEQKLKEDMEWESLVNDEQKLIADMEEERM